MDYFTSTFQDYQPIFVGAGCLAVGYMFGKHCRSMIENHICVPTISDAPCCIKSESNYVSNNNANYLDQDIAKRTKKSGKRDMGQLEIFDYQTINKAPTKKEDVLWVQPNISKKQKGPPIIWRESIETKFESKQDSDDEILARRLEYFTKSASGTGASINKSKGSYSFKVNKKKKTTMDVTTNCENKRWKEIVTKSQKSLSRGTTRSISGLSAFAACLLNQGECSLEDTCKSPKLLYLNNFSEKNEGACQSMALDNDVTTQQETINVPFEKPQIISSVQFVSNNSLEEHTTNNMLSNEVVQMDVESELNICDNNLNHVTIINKEDNKSETMDDIQRENDISNHVVTNNEIDGGRNTKIEDLQSEKDNSNCIAICNEEDNRFETRLEDIEGKNDTSNHVVVENKKDNRIESTIEDINECEGEISNCVIPYNEEINRFETRMKDIEGENDISNHVEVENEEDDRSKSRMEDIECGHETSNCVVVHSKEVNRFGVRIEDGGGENDTSNHVVVETEEDNRLETRIEYIIERDDEIFDCVIAYSEENNRFEARMEDVGGGKELSNLIEVENEKKYRLETRMEDIVCRDENFNRVIVHSEESIRFEASMEDVESGVGISNCIIACSEENDRFEGRMEDIEGDNEISSHVIIGNEEDDRSDIRMEDIESENDIILQNEEKHIDSLTNSSSKSHVQDRFLMEKREIREEHVVSMDKVLKVEIYELLHVADCGKVSFEKIVSLLEEKLKVVLQEDKSHIISLVREVINISKL